MPRFDLIDVMDNSIVKQHAKALSNKRRSIKCLDASLFLRKH